MNEQFALELHRAGDAIAEIARVAMCAPVVKFTTVRIHDDRSRVTFSVCVVPDSDTGTAVINALREFGVDETGFMRYVPVDSNLGAVVAKTYRELFGVFEDAETDSE